MDSIKEYLRYIANITAGTQQRLYSWEAEKTRRIKIVPYSSNKKLKDILDKSFGVSKCGSIKSKECFRNALLACFACQDIEYVEGYIVVSGVPIEHSWNRWKDVDFDLTQEVLLQKNVPHYEILSLDGNQVRMWASNLGTTGPYRVNYFQTHVEKLDIAC